MQAGWTNRSHAQQDPDLTAVRNSAKFQALLAKMDQNKSQPFDVQPTTAFRSRYQWNGRGEKGSVSAHGTRQLPGSLMP